MSAVLIAPIAVPLLAAPLCYLTRHRLGLQRILSALATLSVLGAAVVLLIMTLRDGLSVLEVGSWPAPFGIVLVADTMSAAMAVISGVIGLATVLYSFADADFQAPRLFHPLLLILLSGVSGSFLTGDLFNLYVWFEVILIASFGLLVLGAGPERLDATLKYVVLNFVATTFLLIGIAAPSTWPIWR
jgi:multicomponent Na+:H+ antiporter subunit D